MKTREEVDSEYLEKWKELAGFKPRSALDRVNIARVMLMVKRALNDAIRGLTKSRPLTVEEELSYVQDVAARLREMFPQVAPYEIGPAQVIAGFVVCRGSKRFRFFDRDGEDVKHKQPKVQGLRRQRKWAANQIGLLLCSIKFTPLMPIETVNLKQMLAHDSAPALLSSEEHSGVQGPTIHD